MRDRQALRLAIVIHILVGIGLVASGASPGCAVSVQSLHVVGGSAIFDVLWTAGLTVYRRCRTQRDRVVAYEVS